MKNHGSKTDVQNSKSMKDRSRFLRSTGLIACAFLLFVLPLNAAPRRYQDEDQATSLREMRDTIDTLRHELENHETELRMFEERMGNQESSLGAFRQQLQDANQANKEIVKGNTNSLEGKFTAIESTNKNLTTDLRQLKTHANESAEVLAQYKQKIGELEKSIAMQNQQIDSLKTALSSVMELLQVKEEIGKPSEGGANNYRIKSGDSLEKIAKAHNTTVKVIKELNNLSSDRIVEGRVLKLP